MCSQIYIIVAFLTLFAPNVKGQSPTSTPASSTGSHLLRFGAVVLIIGAVLMLCASITALCLWKVSDKNVSVHKGLCCYYSAPSV